MLKKMQKPSRQLSVPLKHPGARYRPHDVRPLTSLQKTGQEKKHNSLTGINNVSCYYYQQVIIFQQTDVYFNFLVKGRYEPQMMKGLSRVSVKHLTERLRAWMGSTEIDGLGCKAQRTVLCMFDSVICFTSLRLAEKIMILILSQPLKYTSFYNQTHVPNIITDTYTDINSF